MIDNLQVAAGDPDIISSVPLRPPLRVFLGAGEVQALERFREKVPPSFLITPSHGPNRKAAESPSVGCRHTLVNRHRSYAILPRLHCINAI